MHFIFIKTKLNKIKNFNLMGVCRYKGPVEDGSVRQILIFASDRGILNLKHAAVISIDCTFKTTPPPFTQLMFIQVLLIQMYKFSRIYSHCWLNVMCSDTVSALTYIRPDIQYPAEPDIRPDNWFLKYPCAFNVTNLNFKIGPIQYLFLVFGLSKNHWKVLYRTIVFNLDGYQTGYMVDFF